MFFFSETCISGSEINPAMLPDPHMVPSGAPSSRPTALELHMAAASVGKSRRLRPARPYGRTAAPKSVWGPKGKPDRRFTCTNPSGYQSGLSSLYFIRVYFHQQTAHAALLPPRLRSSPDVEGCPLSGVLFTLVSLPGGGILCRIRVLKAGGVCITIWTCFY